MKKIFILLSVLFVMGSCSTKQDIMDGGVCSPYFDGSIMEYLRSDDYNWDWTVQLIERAELTDLFEGKDKNYPEITFLGFTKFSVMRYVWDSGFETVADIPVEQCRELVLKHVFKNKILKKDLKFRKTYEHNETTEDYQIKHDHGCSLFTAIDDLTKVCMFQKKTEWAGVPEAGPAYMAIFSETAYSMVPLASPDIQPKNGVVHALGYEYRLGNI